MEIRQYQTKAIAYLANTRRGIVQAPAGAGKTHIAASALAVCLSKRKKQNMPTIEIMVNTKEQVEQMQTACDRFKIIQQKSRLSIYCAAGAPMGTKPDLLIVDECHRAGADGWSSKITQCESARWGLSATPFNGNPERDQILRKLFGNSIHTIERTQLVTDGHLAKAKVIWHNVQAEAARFAIQEETEALIQKRRNKMPWMFKNDEDARKQESQCKWQAAQRYGIWENFERDAHIELLANNNIKAGNHTIILVGSIEHGKRLVKLISGSELVYSKMGAAKRADVIERFRNGNLKCMVGTSAIEEGFDAPIANVIIMASSGRSARKTIQSTGRVLRPYNDKIHGVIHDFMDSFDPMLQNQSYARKRIYKNMDYLE